jgi:hypothetical protein
MGKFIDITGQKFTRLTVLRISHRSKDRVVYWLCKCDCGNELAVHGYSLRKGRSRSCGCYHAGAVSMSNTTHGHTRGYSTSREYSSWGGMIDRCTNPNNPQYKNYGERGITVHPEWVDSFGAFLAHVGTIPKDGKKYSLDRIDNDQGYIPGNVRWTDQTTQANNRRNNVMITAFGKTMTLPQWSRETGIAIKTLRNRLLSHWTHERTVSEPTAHKGLRRTRKKEETVDELIGKCTDYVCL